MNIPHPHDELGAGKCRDGFGEQGIVELGTILGYYTAIGNALNAFQVPLPAGAPQPFPEYERARRGS